MRRNACRFAPSVSSLNQQHAKYLSLVIPWTLLPYCCTVVPVAVITPPESGVALLTLLRVASTLVHGYYRAIS